MESKLIPRSSHYSSSDAVTEAERSTARAAAAGKYTPIDVDCWPASMKRDVRRWRRGLMLSGANVIASILTRN